MDVLFKETDWLCYTCFHQEIAADGQARRGGRLLRANERPRKKLHEKGQTDKDIHT